MHGVGIRKYLATSERANTSGKFEVMAESPSKMAMSENLFFLEPIKLPYSLKKRYNLIIKYIGDGYVILFSDNMEMIGRKIVKINQQPITTQNIKSIKKIMYEGGYAILQTKPGICMSQQVCLSMLNISDAQKKCLTQKEPVTNPWSKSFKT